MSRHLGALGKRKVAEEVTFDWFGCTIRTNPSASELAFIDFIERGSNIELPDDMNNPTAEDIQKMQAAIPAVKNFLRQLIHTEDFDVFWDTARIENQSLQDLMETAMQLIEGVSGRPTKSRRSSSTGPRPTARRSGAGLSSRAIRRLDKAGRGDLAVAIIRRQEAEARDAAAG